MARRLFTVTCVLSALAAAWSLLNYCLASYIKYPELKRWREAWGIFTLLFLVLPAWRVVRAYAEGRTRTRDLASGQSGLCPACGYDLRATPGRCPECGAEPAATTQGEV